MLKVSVNEELYNIIQIKDRKDAMIFVVDFKEIYSHQSLLG